MSIISPIVSNIISPIQQSITAAEARYLPEFVIASSQYGDMNTDWTPTTVNWRIGIDFTVGVAATGALQNVLFGNAEGSSPIRIYLTTDGRIAVQYQAGGNVFIIPSLVYGDGQRVTATIRSSGAGVELYVNGTLAGSNAAQASEPVFNRICANSTPAEFFGGTYHSLQFIDDNDPTNTRNHQCNEASGDRLHDSNDPTQYNSYGFNGDSYMTFPPIAVDAGYTIPLKFIAPLTARTARHTMIARPSDPIIGDAFYAEQYEDGTIRLAGCTAELDGVPVVNLSTVFPNDGKQHNLVVTATVSTYFGQVGRAANELYAADFPIYNVRIYNDTGTLIHHYPMNNSKQVQPDVVGGNDGTIEGTYSADNWAVRGDNDIILIGGVERVTA